MQTQLLELNHTDVADYKNVVSKSSHKNYITFVNDCSRFTGVYLLKSKDEAEGMIFILKTEVANQLDRKIKRLRSDCGGEYGSDFLTDFGQVLFMSFLPLTLLNIMV